MLSKMWITGVFLVVHLGQRALRQKNMGAGRNGRRCGYCVHNVWITMGVIHSWRRSEKWCGKLRRLSTVFPQSQELSVEKLCISL